MADISFNDIEKAVNQLKQYGVAPSKFYCSHVRAKQFIDKAHELGIQTKGADGNDYLLGMKIVSDKRLPEDIMYVSDK